MRAGFALPKRGSKRLFLCSSPPASPSGARNCRLQPRRDAAVVTSGSATLGSADSQGFFEMLLPRITLLPQNFIRWGKRMKMTRVVLGA